MKKVIFSVILIAIVGALVGIGTWAAFSDVETSPGNMFTGGTMDLRVDGEDDPSVRIMFDNITCVKPGDSGETVITLTNEGCVDGIADIHLIITEDSENGIEEPESCVDTWTDVDGDTYYDPAIDIADPDGELAENMDMRITADLFVPIAPPVIDGTVGPGEWDGATVIDVASSMGTVSVIAETDYVYVLFQVADSTDARVPGENIHGNDQTSININPTPGATNWGKPCDIIFQTGADPAAWGGTSSGLTDSWLTDWEIDGTQLSSLPSGLETKTIYSGGTRISEWKLPLASIVGLQPGDILDVAGTANVGDGSSYCYPPELNVGNVPANWGDLSIFVDVLCAPRLQPGKDGIYETQVAAGKVDELDCENVEFALLAGATVPPYSYVDILIEWWVHPDVGNIIMTDILKFDIEFSLNQAMAAALKVVSIQQPPAVQPCELITIAVDVKNAGGAEGEGTVDVVVTLDDGTPVAEVLGVATGMIQPLETVKLPITADLHADPAWLGQTIIVSAQATDDAEPVPCEIDVSLPPCIVVTKIQQPEIAYICDELVVAVDVHNAGEKPGECWVEVWVYEDTGGGVPGDPVVGPFVEDVPKLNPGATAKIPVVIGHVDDWWPENIVVVAVGCCGEPWFCPILIVPPPPVPEPCCWCIYDTQWWEGVEEPARPPDNQEYFAMHTEEWLDPGHTETITPPIGDPFDIVIPDPSWHQELTGYAGPLPNGYPGTSEWDPLVPGAVRFNAILKGVIATSVGYWNSSLTMLNWKARFDVITVTGAITLYSWTISIDNVVGNAGWPFAVGNYWETTGASMITPPSLSRSTVIGMESIPGPATSSAPSGVGNLNCYKVYTEAFMDTDGDEVPDTWVPSGIKWYHNDYGCPIKSDTYPGALYYGWEFQDLIWYCSDPPFPPWEP